MCGVGLWKFSDFHSLKWPFQTWLLVSSDPTKVFKPKGNAVPCPDRNLFLSSFFLCWEFQIVRNGTQTCSTVL